MQLHEAITWTGGFEVDGDYIAEGAWSGDVFLGVSGETLIGDYEGELGSGSLQGSVKGQVITGTWYGNDGSQGSFALQIQDEGNHLFGRWDMDDDNWRDWSLKRA